MMVQWSSSWRWEWVPVITCCSGLPEWAGSLCSVPRAFLLGWVKYAGLQGGAGSLSPPVTPAVTIRLLRMPHQNYREIKAGGQQGSPKRVLVLSHMAGLSCVTAAVSLGCHPDARSARVSRAAISPWKGTGFRPAACPRSPASPPAHPRKTRQAKGHPFHLKCISF